MGPGEVMSLTLSSGGGDQGPGSLGSNPPPQFLTTCVNLRELVHCSVPQFPLHKIQVLVVFTCGVELEPNMSYKGGRYVVDVRLPWIRRVVAALASCLGGWREREHRSVWAQASVWS